MATMDDVKVSPEEIDALMATIQSTSDGRSRELGKDGAVHDVVSFDLVNARAGSQGRLPTLELINDRVAKALASRLSNRTSQQTDASAQATEALKFADCISSLASPGCLQVLELTGLRGTGILYFEPTLLFHMVDLLLGGKPTKLVDGVEILRKRGLTKVERRLFNYLAEALSEAVSESWESVTEFGIRPTRIETDTRQVALFEPGEMVVVSSFEVTIVGCTGTVHLVIPQASLRPIEKVLASGLLEEGADESGGWGAALTRLMREVTVECSAELGRTEMSLRELVELKVGDIVRLDRDPESTITVYVEGASKMHGVPTMRHGNIAVEIVQKVDYGTETES